MSEGETVGQVQEGELRYTIDRIEDDLAVLVDDERRVVEVPRWVVPPSARAGDVLTIVVGLHDGSWIVRSRVDAESSEVARAAAEARLRALRLRDQSGDLEL